MNKKQQKSCIEGWRNDPRMVYLANKKRDLTPREIEEWERNIGYYQLKRGPSDRQWSNVKRGKSW